MNRYVKKLALMVPYIKGYYEEIERLRSRGIKYLNCGLINDFNLVFYGWRFETGDECMSFCCMSNLKYPVAALCETAEESIKAIIKLRAEIMAENIRLRLLGRYNANKNRFFSLECEKCPHFCLNNWDESDGLIHSIVLSLYPSPCQCRCIYCTVPQSFSMQQFHTESYKKVFAIIEWAQENGMTSRDLRWQVSSGEITIHPLRDRIFSLVNDQTATFFTNCFIFDEKIAANLAANPQSSISFSVDSGTSETWHKVKGVDNFDTVIENLERYIASGACPDQIRLKYIILPGVNDNKEDYRSIIGIMNRLEIRHLMVSIDDNTKQNEIPVRQMGYLLAMLRKNGSKTEFSCGSVQGETGRISIFADELLESGEV